MIKLEIYDYSSNASRDRYSVVISGYNFSGVSYPGGWHQSRSSAYINCHSGASTGASKISQIKFGKDDASGKCIIDIGDGNTTWYYPNVWITEVLLAWSGAGGGNWKKDWSVDFVPSSSLIGTSGYTEATTITASIN